MHSPAELDKIKKSDKLRLVLDQSLSFVPSHGV